jgi:hypothetical protein
VLTFAVLAGLLAWAVFSRLPPMVVRVGFAASGATVPLGYQLSVFPVFGAFCGALALDLVRGDDRRTWLPRAALVATTGLLSVARVAGTLPLSGHALFLFAVLGYELALVIPSLLVVGWCKLVVWGDPLWFGASAVLGTALGAVLARIARA